MERFSLPNIIYFELSPFIYVNLFILTTSLTKQGIKQPSVYCSYNAGGDH